MCNSSAIAAPAPPDRTTEERNALVEQNLGIVHFVVGRLQQWPAVRRLGVDEALSVGFEALLEIAGRYDPSKGWPFSTGAFSHVRRRVLQAAFRAVRQPVPLTDVAPPGEDASGFEPPAPDEPNAAEQQDEAAALWAALDAMDNETDALVVAAHFGLLDGQEYDFQATARLLGRTRERVRQRFERGLAELRTMLSE